MQRPLSALLALLATLALAAPALAGDGGAVERGIVQSVASDALRLKTLDGQTLTVVVDRTTKLFVNDRHAALKDVRPGFVAVVELGKRSAKEIRAISAAVSAPPPLRGPPPGPRVLVESVAGDAVVLRLDGRSQRIGVDGRTAVYVSGAPATLRDVHSGYRAVVIVAGGNDEGGQRRGPRDGGDAVRVALELWAYPSQSR